MKQVIIQNSSLPLPDPIRANYCSTFFSKFRGLMLRSMLDSCQGILLVENKDSRMDTAIHMLFMQFDIAAVWINSSLEVVDVRLARKWQPMLIPASPARFVLEAHPSLVSRFKIGDRIEMTNV